MAEVKTITPEELIENGFVKCPDNSIDLYERVISVESDDDELGPLKIVVTHMSGPIEFCLLLCEGQRLYLQPNSLEELEQFINCINRYEPVW